MTRARTLKAVTMTTFNKSAEICVARTAPATIKRIAITRRRGEIEFIFTNAIESDHHVYADLRANSNDIVAFVPSLLPVKQFRRFVPFMDDGQRRGLFTRI